MSKWVLGGSGDFSWRKGESTGVDSLEGDLDVFRLEGAGAVGDEQETKFGRESISFCVNLSKAEVDIQVFFCLSCRGDWLG